MKSISITTQGPVGGGPCDLQALIHISTIPLELCDCHVGCRQDGHVLDQHGGAIGEGEGDSHACGRHKHVPGLCITPPASNVVGQATQGGGRHLAAPIARGPHQIPSPKDCARRVYVVGRVLGGELLKCQ